jgi:hypothetical protein
MQQRAQISFHLAITALGGIVAIAANRDYYSWALISVVTALLAFLMMQRQKSRKLFVAAFVALGSISFVVGRFYFKNHQLDDNGLFLMWLFGILPMVIVSWRIYALESSKEHENAPPPA